MKYTEYIMTRREKSFITGCVLVSSVLFVDFTMAGIRCGTKVVNKGDSSQYVEKICGSPELKQQRSVIVTRGLEGNTLISNGRNYRSNKNLQQYLEYSEQVIIDEWEYNFGPNRLKQKVTFENGRIISIESAGYGY